MLIRLLAALLVLAQGAVAQHSKILDRINLPDGFSISVFAEVPQARHMATGPDGAVYVTTKGERLYRLMDADGDGVAERQEIMRRGLNHPGGVAYHKGVVYVGLLDRVIALDGAGERVVLSGFEPSRLHGRRILGVGPDERLYVSLGAPCNICSLKENTGKIVSVGLDGKGVRLVADGVRNSVGFDWNPRTGKLWFTDNGADRMGDDLPADELNVVSREGEHFGFPWRGGRATPLTGYIGQTPPMKVTGAALEMAPHSANLGMDFYQGAMFPRAYRGDAFVAQRGSWNRSVPIGYRVMRVRFDGQGNAVGKEVFADGWLSGGRKLGRPVDVEERPDGSILVSDDRAGLIYRIAYGG